MNAPLYRDIARDAVWRQNAGVVQLLGLCPLLAVSTTLINGVALGMATILVMGLSNLAVALVHGIVPREVRIPVFILIIAALVTILQLMMNAFVHPLYVVLGIFVPLITTNCLVLARAETFAARSPAPAALLDGVMMGVGLTLVLGLLGGMRELAGKGTLLTGMELAFGASAKHLTVHLMPRSYSFPLATLPPGAFIALGFLIAAKSYWSRRDADRGQISEPELAKQVI
jgi:H+/Na+-translocating ferredoxin:NAD+ oxidoreductase subunit E